VAKTRINHPLGNGIPPIYGDDWGTGGWFILVLPTLLLMNRNQILGAWHPLKQTVSIAMMAAMALLTTLEEAEIILLPSHDGFGETLKLRLTSHGQTWPMKLRTKHFK